MRPGLASQQRMMTMSLLRPYVTIGAEWDAAPRVQFPWPIVNLNDGAALMEHRNSQDAEDGGKQFPGCYHPRNPMCKMGALLQSLHFATKYVM